MILVKEPGAMAKGLCLDPTAGSSSGSTGASSSFDSASLLPVLLVLLVLGLHISKSMWLCNVCHTH